MDFTSKDLEKILKCGILIIGAEPQDFGWLSPDILFTKVPSENLKWTSFVIKKVVPEKSFSRIFVDNPDIFYTPEGNIDRRVYCVVSRALKDDGRLYIRGLLEVQGFPDEFRFEKFTEIKGKPFQIYARTECLSTSKKITKTAQKPGEYQLLNFELFQDPSEESTLENFQITLEEFKTELETDEFIKNFLKAILSLLAYKKELYLEKKGEVKKKFDALQRKVRYVRSVGVDSTTIREMYPMYDFYAGFLFELDEMYRYIERLQRNTDTSQVKKNLLEAIYDPMHGLESLVGRIDIKNQLVSQLYAFSRNWRVFVGNFCNFALMGPSGVGKTVLGQVISFVFAKSGILAMDHIHVVSRTDLVGQYIGQTAPRTRSLLLASLEGVLFIDEAYQLAMGDTRDFGNEAITEIVNFLDKYIGMSVVIVAGYKDLMKEKFFPSNEGLERRFPHQIILEAYTLSQLTDILVNFIEKSLPSQLSQDLRNFLFTMLTLIHQKHPHVFDKQAGDMLNLGAAIITAIYSSYRIRWDSQNPKDNQRILREAFRKFLRTKSHCL